MRASPPCWPCPTSRSACRSKVRSRARARPRNLCASCRKIRSGWAGSSVRPGSRASKATLFWRQRLHALERELLHALAVLDFRHVQIALRVHVHVMDHVELARRNTGTSERIERLEGFAVAHPDARGAAARDVQEILLG